jgi:hypothetical protein
MLFTSTTVEYGVISYSTSHIFKRPADCERIICSVRLSLRGNACFVSQSLSGSYYARLSLSGSYVMRLPLSGSYVMRLPLSGSYVVRLPLSGVML